MRRRKPDTTGDVGFRPWHFFVLASLMAATAGVALSHGTSPANLVLVSLSIGAAGSAGLGFYRMLAPLVADAAGVGADTLGARTRATLEREKVLVLRTIKELEFDRAMGKVSVQDFDEMVTRLRARAIALMKQLDQGRGAYRDLIERELLSRLGAPPARPAAAAAPERATPGAVVSAEAAEASASCAACGTANDPDARFCKQCGARLVG
jgi:hypothetical protein